MTAAATPGTPQDPEQALLQRLRREQLQPQELESLLEAYQGRPPYQLLRALAAQRQLPDNWLRQLIPQLRTFDLVHLCFQPGPGEDHRLVAEQTLRKRLPQLPLGQKNTLARRAPTNLLPMLLQDGTLPVFKACLDNPRLRQGDLLRTLRSAFFTVLSDLPKPVQTYLNRFSADFLLHRGRFHFGLSTQASAFLSTG